jgi:GNAT superfamily N-acetyltransferase
MPKMIACGYHQIMMDSADFGEYTFNTDRTKLQRAVIHGYLTTSYWSPGIPSQTVDRAIEHSLCVGGYHMPTGSQVAFARVVTDYATTMYLCDVFVLTAHRGTGLGVALVEFTLNLPSLQGMRSNMLMTKDAHDLYRKFGFDQHSDPSRFMIRKVPYPYSR